MTGFVLELILAVLVVFMALMLVTGVLTAIILGLSSLVMATVQFVRPRRRKHH